MEYEVLILLLVYDDKDSIHTSLVEGTILYTYHRYLDLSLT